MTDAPDHATSSWGGVFVWVYYIQNLNAYDSRLKGRMFRFRGVATKNLPNYPSWHRYLDVPKTQSTPRKFLTTALDGTST